MLQGQFSRIWKMSDAFSNKRIDLTSNSCRGFSKNVLTDDKLQLSNWLCPSLWICRYSFLWSWVINRSPQSWGMLWGSSSSQCPSLMNPRVISKSFPMTTNRGTCLIATKVPSSDILPSLVPVKSWQRAAFRLHMESPPPISQSPHFLICDIWQWNESVECISDNHLLLANWIVPLLLIPPPEVLLAWMTVPFFMLALTCSCSY